jgi:hypothetical protein
MSSTLISILASAERFGKVQASLVPANDGEEPIPNLVNQCIRNELINMVTFQSVIQPSGYDPSRSELQRTAISRIIDDSTKLESWTLGKDCAWFSGERDGYHYSVFFKKLNGPKLGYIRITLDEVEARPCNCRLAPYPCEDCR